MPTGTRSRAVDIFLGWNLPFFLWTAAAVFGVFFDATFTPACPIRSLLKACPGCGLTDAYVRFLKGQGVANAWFGFVFAGFIANFIFSVFNVLRHERVD